MHEPTSHTAQYMSNDSAPMRYTNFEHVTWPTSMLRDHIFQLLMWRKSVRFLSVEQTLADLLEAKNVMLFSNN